jgi:hypothetical protein
VLKLSFFLWLHYEHGIYQQKYNPWHVVVGSIGGSLHSALIPRVSLAYEVTALSYSPTPSRDGCKVWPGCCVHSLGFALGISLRALHELLGSSTLSLCGRVAGLVDFIH